jgi:2-methylcitrate dehydratase PrpD
MIEGPYGFLLTYSNNPNWQILRQLGQPYEITRNAVKLNPVSRSLSSMVDATLELVRQNNIQPQDVKQIIVEVPRSIHDIIARESLKNPEIPEEARSSSYYWAAVAIIKKRVWLDGFDAGIFETPEVRSLAQKVSCLHNPELDKDFPKKLPSVVTVELKDGQSFRSRVDYPKGEPENPVSWKELLQRNDAIFNYCAKRVITEERYSEIISRIQHMEKESDVGKLVSLFASNMG